MSDQTNTRNIRNILLIGRTGNGKSTLGNVLVNKNGEFEEVFRESSSATTSETRDIQTEEFTMNNINYRVIDTVGIGDTKLSEKDVLYKLSEAAYKVRDGLNQILFVTSGRFTEEEISTYNLLRELIFDEEIVKYTTIVRTRFENFWEDEYENERKDDVSRVCEENPKLSSIIKSCNKIIHVNNPSLINKKKLALSKEDRENSRSKLLLHLSTCQANYKPKNLDSLNADYNYQYNQNQTNTRNIRNILLIGRTGNGKSTLGNVLVNKNDEFEEVFKESGYGNSETRDIGAAEFTMNNINYRVIDTVGIGDTKLSKKNVLYKLGEAAYKVRDGLNQILFVTSGRFTEEEISTYNLLRELIFDKEIVKYTTIVRTKFENFWENEYENERREDVSRMKEENPKLSDVIKSCNNIIHVNNPPLNNKKRLALYKEDRENSRYKLLLHLGTCQGNYKSKNLDDLNAKIGDHMSEIEELKQQLKDTQNLLEEQRKQMQSTINELEEKVSQQTKGWFERLGGLLGEGVDNTIKTTKNAIKKVKEKCNVM